jgi:hypothetical protein
MALTPEQYKEIADKVSAGENVTLEEAALLVQALAEVDTQAVIFQNAIVLCNENLQTIARSLVEEVTKKSGRTGEKFKRAVDKLLDNALNKHIVSLNMYLVNAFEDARKALGIEVEETQEETSEQA